MKRKRFTTIILLIVMIGLIGLVFYAKMNKPTQKRVPFFNIKTDDVHAFSLSRTRINHKNLQKILPDSLYIEKIDSEWFITYPTKRTVNKKRLDFFLNDFLKIHRFGKILTTNPMNFDYYNVSELRGNRVVIFDKNNNIIDDIYLGLADLTSYGAVRRNHENIVYELAMNLSYDLSPSMSVWRENYIVYFNASETDSVRVNFSSSSYTLINNDTQWFYQDDYNLFPLTNAHKAFTSAMIQLENLTTYSYLDDLWDEYKSYFDKPILEINIFKKDNQIDRLVFARYDDTVCLIKVNNKINELYIGNYGMVNRFTKSPESYMDLMRFAY